MACLEIFVLCRDKLFRSTVWKFLVFISGGAGVALLCVSFFTFLGITNAFSQDNACTLFGSNLFYCQSLLSNQHIGFPANGTLYWEPFAGWWMLMVAIIFAILSVLGAILSRR